MLPKSFMAENNAFLLLTASIRNFYKFLMGRLDIKSLYDYPQLYLEDAESVTTQ